MPEEAANRVGGAPVARAPASTATLSCAPTPPLSELPKPALLNVFSRLAAEDLAALCLQERGLRDAVADAGDVELWAPLCAARWPGAALADYQTSGHYAGGWRQMYAARRGLPPAFLSCVDRCRSLRTLSAAPSPTDYAAFAKTSFTVFLEVERQPQLARTPEFARHCADHVSWLAADPALLAGFVADADALAQEYDMWGVGFLHWPDVPWRRSVAEFITTCMASRGQLPAEALAHAQQQLESLDNTIRSIEEESESLQLPLPEGIPRSHWWYFLHGRPFSVSHVC
eukprot:jgi/Tetstr1/422175/TSEL_013028.t1